ncbi:Multidrug resistance protein fnx1 [Cladobotryum mycophilum]|uniref:Multidrug resistance protein fnx1 n=1 Tax=Cladobotryum mycophilum TaxID=491253 RepID=A0ABR0T3B6_9HYPO
MAGSGRGTPRIVVGPSRSPADSECSSGSGPVPIAAGRRGLGYGSTASAAGSMPQGSSHDMDADLFNLLSRSLPTSGGGLEPEPVIPAMMWHEVESISRRRRPDIDDEEEAFLTESDDETEDEDPELTETSPLVRHASRASRASRMSRASRASTLAEGPLFLNGTSPERFWIIFAQILVTTMISCFDGTIMASSHPVITSYFKAANSASWLSTAFLLTSTAFQPLLGRLSDAVGRKPLFVLCLTIFAVATFWCGAARTIEEFVAARAVCGMGAGGTMTLGSIITSDLVPIERRGAYQSYINVVFGIGSAAGAALGGAMADALGWRWEFYVQVPPLLVCIVFAVMAIPPDIGLAGPRKSVREALRSFDFMGSALLTTTIAFLILGLNLGGNILPWSHPFVVTSLVIATVFFPTFLFNESRAEKPIMPLHLLRQPPRANLIFSGFLGGMILNAILFNIPLYFQAVLLTSATSSGLRLVLPSIVASIAGTTTGFAITWTRRLKWPIVTGTVFYLAGCLSLCLLRRGLPGIIYLVVLVPQSLGQGFQFPGTIMAILASSGQAEQAVVTTTLILWRSIGMVLGVAASSLVIQNSLLHYMNLFIVGDRKDEVMQLVRQSVEIVAKLDEPYREQVVRSYEASLRLTFILASVIAAISVLIILPIKLPHLALSKRKS